MDLVLKRILDTYIPYDDEDYYDAKLWMEKTCKRQRLANAIIAYKNLQPQPTLSVDIDITDILKNLISNN
jgi:hypothetical protein